jgi:cobalt-zinc-cadmium efflux system membrane fusion protein
MRLNQIILLFALVSAFAACSHSEAKKEEVNKTFVLSDTMLKTTTTASVISGPVKNELKFYGKITVDNNKLIEVFPVVGGNVIKVYVELGDYINKGQVLATIRSTEVAGFEKDMQDAKNDLLVTKNNVKVAEELFEGKLNAERDVLEAKSQFEKAQSQLERIRQTYKIYNIKAGSIYQVVAPMSGFIIEKNINQAMQLRSDRSDNIFDIAQIDDVWAIANVNESEIQQVKLGVDAYVTTLSYPDKVFHAKVDKIFNVIDPETKAMKVRVKLKNSGFLLKPDMRASIRLSFNEDKSLLSIPSEAVIFDKSRAHVMVFKDRYNIETRHIEVYRQVGDITYLTSGLQENEKVITRNQLLIYDALND